MPQLNIRSVEDFENWCRRNSPKIMERFPQTDESIEFEDMEIGEIYILQNKGFMAKGRKWNHILYITDKHEPPSGVMGWDEHEQMRRRPRIRLLYR